MCFLAEVVRLASTLSENEWPDQPGPGRSPLAARSARWVVQMISIIYSLGDDLVGVLKERVGGLSLGNTGSALRFEVRGQLSRGRGDRVVGTAGAAGITGETGGEVISWRGEVEGDGRRFLRR